MSTTISTQHHHRLPLLASLSVVGVIAAAGVVGVAIHDSTTSGTHAKATPAQAQPRPGADENATVAERGQVPNGYAQYQHYYNGQKIGGSDFQPTTSGGHTVVGP